jgi:uncharacterized membrane protein YqaE (UPF0057 family)
LNFRIFHFALHILPLVSLLDLLPMDLLRIIVPIRIIIPLLSVVAILHDIAVNFILQLFGYIAGSCARIVWPIRAEFLYLK